MVTTIRSTRLFGVSTKIEPLAKKGAAGGKGGEERRAFLLINSRSSFTEDSIVVIKVMHHLFPFFSSNLQPPLPRNRSPVSKPNPNQKVSSRSSSSLPLLFSPPLSSFPLQPHSLARSNSQILQPLRQSGNLLKFLLQPFLLLLQSKSRLRVQRSKHVASLAVVLQNSRVVLPEGRSMGDGEHGDSEFGCVVVAEEEEKEDERGVVRQVCFERRLE